MAKIDYDVIVVGGGLAGLSAGCLLAKDGVNVCLIEKHQYPFHRVCGEYISYESWEFLERLGLDLKTHNLPIINRLLVSDCVGKPYNFNLDLGGFGISRYMLDALLVQRFKALGGTLLENTLAENLNATSVQIQGRSLEAKLVLGAFGKRSNIDFKLNRRFVSSKPNKLNNYVGIKYHIRHAHAKDTIALHNFEGGYCGMSAIENDLSCLCYMVHAQMLKGHNNSIAELENKVLKKNTALKYIFDEAAFAWEKPLVISQINFEAKNQVENGVLMLGDAAGLIPPLCGNGMSMALHASQMAATTVKALLNNHSSEKIIAQYTDCWQKNFGLRLRAGRIIQPLFGKPLATAMFLRLMDTIPFVATHLIKLTHGKPF